MQKRILIVTTEILPSFNEPCAGGGVRAYTLGEALRARGHDVEYAICEDTLRGRQPADSNVTVVSYNHWTLNDTILRVKPDVVLFEQWYPLSYLKPIDIPVVVDLPGPLILENWHRGIGDVASNAMVKLRALAKADLFVYATERQRAYWQAWLPLSGVAPNDDCLVHAPIRLSPARPEPAPPADEFVVIYAGMFWAWQDPAAGLRMILQAMEDRGRGRCVVVGGRHPDHAVEGERYAELPPDLLNAPRLTIHQPVPFNDLVAGLTRCQLAVDTGPRNAERELSSNIRTVVYLWAGLPVVISDHAYLAEWVLKYNAGWVVPGTGGDQLRQIIAHALDHPEDVQQRAEGARKLAEERLVWSPFSDPLAARLNTLKLRQRLPTLMADAVKRLERAERDMEALRRKIAELDTARHELYQQAHDLKHELGAIRGRFLFRLDSRLRRWLGRD